MARLLICPPLQGLDVQINIIHGNLMFVYPYMYVKVIAFADDTSVSDTIENPKGLVDGFRIV